MNRASHTTTSAITHKAMLSARTHAKDRTELIRASNEHGLVISHALSTQALPGMTGDNQVNYFDKLIEQLDETIDTITELKDELTKILKEFETDE